MKLTIRLLFIIIITGISLRNIFSQVDGSFVSQSDFKTTMEILWGDHVILTREVIIDVIDDRDGTNEAIENLRKNQRDIGNALRGYYGNNIADKLTSILDYHVTLAANFLKAIKADDANSLESAKQKWYANGDSIVTYLIETNSFLASNELTQMMRDHLAATIEEAFARFKKDTSADLAAYAKVHSQILLFADMLADGIIKQFPEKFI
jgi:hypothetical protein